MTIATALALLLIGCGTKRATQPTQYPEAPSDIAKRPTHKPQPWTPPMGDSIRYEMRAVWLTTAYGLDWPKIKADTPNGIRRQKEELERILDRLVSDGYNTVFFQARLSGNTAYHSTSEPFSRVFTTAGERPEYDPLEFAIEACHRRRMKIHAWLVTYPLTSTRQRPHPIVQKNPAWAILHEGGRHLDPGNPEVRAYIAELSADIARRYKVDGLHYDYFRYPENADKFNDKRSYDKYGSGIDRTTWRRQNLTKQLEEIQRAIRPIRPALQISVAPLGKLRQIPTLGKPHGWTAYESVYQDVETWAQNALVDFVVPMMYYKDHLYEPFLIDWQNTVGKYIPIIAGLAPYRVDPSEKYPWAPITIAEQIKIARRHGAAGISMFREGNIGERAPRVRTLIQHEFRLPAVQPVLTRGLAHKPNAPQNLRLSVSGQQLTLRWEMPQPIPSGTTYRVWATTTHESGAREALLLVDGLAHTQCTMHLVDFSEGDCLELGVEAVNTFGVSTPSVQPIEFNLANDRAHRIR